MSFLIDFIFLYVQYFFIYLKNSLIVSFSSMVISIILSVSAAYGLHKLKFYGNKFGNAATTKILANKNTKMNVIKQ